MLYYIETSQININYLTPINFRVPLIFAHFSRAKIRGGKFAHEGCAKIKGARTIEFV